MNERTEVVERAARAYSALAELAETIEDEWVYVNDLVEAYLPAIEALGAGGALGPDAVAAVDEAIAEISLITDPHKAIDWLSTFPHIVAPALGGEVDGPGGRARGGGDVPGFDDDPPATTRHSACCWGVESEIPGRRPRRQSSGVRGHPGRSARGSSGVADGGGHARRALDGARGDERRAHGRRGVASHVPGAVRAGRPRAARARRGPAPAASLDVANRGEAARSQYRGAIVEELTARLLAARPAPARPVR